MTARLIRLLRFSSSRPAAATASLRFAGPIPEGLCVMGCVMCVRWCVYVSASVCNRLHDPRPHRPPPPSCA
jgi:hypothetical protein